MKKLSLILLVLAIIACKQKETKNEIPTTKFTLSGTIAGEYTDYIFLGYGDHKDSTMVTDGKFKFTGKLDLPTQQGWLNLRPLPLASTAFIYLEGSHITVEAQYNQEEANGQKANILEIKDIQGSKTAIFQENYREFWKNNKDKENFNELLYQRLIKLFQEHPKHSFSGKILGEIASGGARLKINELEHLYTLIDTNYQNKYDLEYYRNGIKSLKKFNIGSKFIPFSLENPTSQLVNNNDYKGKYTLVDFWASWCRPCRSKHPELIELYSEFHSEAFDIISISIDDNEDDWKKAIEQDALIWENLIDTEKNISNELGIQGIPHNYLLNPEGEIIAINLPIEEIKRILNTQINS